MRKALSGQITKVKAIDGKANPPHLVTFNFEGLAENQTQDGETGLKKQGKREHSEKEANKAKENQQSHKNTNIYKGST